MCSLPIRLADRLTGLPKRFNRFSKEVQPVLVNLTNLCSSLPVRLADSPSGLPGAVQPVLDRVLAQTASFEAPPIYTHFYLSPHTSEHDLTSISNLRHTSHYLSHISCLSHFKYLERNLREIESCSFCASSLNPSCSSSFELWYYIEFFVDSLLL
jgi:uncharacterized CHY-type Zn-finger protein